MGVRPSMNEPSDAAMPGSRTRIVGQGYIPQTASGLSLSVAVPGAINAGLFAFSQALDLRGYTSITIVGSAITNNLDVTLELQDPQGVGGSIGSIVVGTFPAGGAQTILTKTGIAWPLVFLKIKNNTAGNATLQTLTGLYCSS